MASRSEQEKVQSALTKAITFVCQDILQDHLNINIDALIGITLNDKDVILVSMKEAIHRVSMKQAIQSQQQTRKPQTALVSSEQPETGQEQINNIGKEESCPIDSPVLSSPLTTEKSTGPQTIPAREPINIVPLDSGNEGQWPMNLSKAHIMQKDTRKKENSTVEIIPKFLPPPIKTEPDEVLNTGTKNSQFPPKKIDKIYKRQGTPPVPDKVGRKLLHIHCLFLKVSCTALHITNYKQVNALITTCTL